MTNINNAEEWEDTKAMLKRFGMYVLGFGAAFSAAHGVPYFESKYQENRMSQGFRPGYEFKVESNDLDKDGKYETVLYAPGQTNLLKKVHGEYKLVPFTLESKAITNTQVSVTNKTEIVTGN